MAAPTSTSAPELLDGLPAVPRLRAEDVAEAASGARRLVVLDDDPTGTQTVADVPIVTAWEDDDLRWALRQGGLGFYVLTNTRSLAPAAAARRNEELVATLAGVAREERVEVAIVSRGDSTLRGHFPLEVDVLAAAHRTHLGRAIDAVVIAPAYIDAGRITVDSVHWVRTSDGFVPAGASEFAADPVFGYESSDLRDYVAEKSAGRWRREDVARITLAELRSGGTHATAAVLLGLADGRPVVVDAQTDEDLRVLALAAIKVEAAGRSLLYRVGPSFVRNRLGQAARPPLTDATLAAAMCRPQAPATPPRAAGGLVVAGSHVALTTRQLERLLRSRATTPVVLDVAAVLATGYGDELLDAVAGQAVAALASGDVVLHTSRELVRGDGAEGNLAVGARVSDAIVAVVRATIARIAPRWIVAKGGITANDVATRALGIRRAWVRGTLLPGIVSLWEPVGEASAPYVVFAGNVGDDEALATVVSRLRAAG